MERRFTFDGVADLYEAARPDYPQSLVDGMFAIADLNPGDRVLEIGCGTGKATVAMAHKGHPIVAVDPGEELIAAARKALGGAGDVTFSRNTFEDWSPEPEAFGLAVAAQSIHWVSPELQFNKPADALRPGGWIAIFGNVPMPIEGALGDDIAGIYERSGPTVKGVPPEAGYLPTGPFAALIVASGRFGPVEHHAYAWTRRHTPQSYVALMSTMSNHIMLEASQRAALLDGVAKAIETHGGGFDLGYQTHLYMARKA